MKDHNESYYAFKPIFDNPIKLDFTGCGYLGEIHKVLKESFGLPEYYGENWDALWDCLDYLFVDDGEMVVEIFGLQCLPDDLRKECNKMLEVFDDVHQDTPNVKFQLIS